MNGFHYINEQLFVEKCPVTSLAAEFGTPLYIYSRQIIENRWQAFKEALAPHSHRICYAVKANSNLTLLNFFANQGAGFDIVSEGELERVIAAGGDHNKIVFSGVGKKPHEIARALQLGIYCFNVESESELDTLQRIACELNKTAAICLRVNPNIDANTHPYIATGLQDNKFGITRSAIPAISKKIKTLSHIELIGLGSHIGSQLTALQPFLDTLDCLCQLYDELSSEGHGLKNINMGGGLGVRYEDETPPDVAVYVHALYQKLGNRPVEIILEPGRALIAEAAILVTKIEYLKMTEHKNFAIVDAAMNDFIRPALYESWHAIIPVIKRNALREIQYDIVGPVCESADFFGKNRNLSIKEADLLAIKTVGAYGFCMSSNYNSRPRAAEILVADDHISLIRKRESLQDLFIHEL